MAVKPIIFSGPMVKALLAGTKSQTRRVIKPQPPSDVVRHCWFHAPVYGFTADADITTNWHTARLLAQEGDLLYVREAWQSNGLNWNQPISGMHNSLGRVHYRATDEGDWKPYWGAWKPSIHMPRWASRLTLEVNNVRVQRVQDISEEDARAEGVTPGFGGGPILEDFACLWNSIHGAFAWSKDPWVAAYTFTVHRCNVDDLLRQREAA